MHQRYLRNNQRNIFTNDVTGILVGPEHHRHQLLAGEWGKYRLLNITGPLVGQWARQSTKIVGRCLWE